MVQIKRVMIENIPSLLVADEENAPKSVIVYFHGFSSAKEQNLSQAYHLATRGFRVILPDSLHHGERKEEKNLNKIQFDFWKIVSQNISELHTIYEWVKKEEGLKEEDQFGVAGTSMGGITAASALTQYDWIQSAGIMMGSAKTQEMANHLIEGIKQQGVKLPFTDDEIQSQLDSLKPVDLSLQMEKLQSRPLFIWHGYADRVVPFKHASSFVETVLERDPEYPLTFITEKDRDHKVSREAMIQLAEWFENHS